MTYKSYNQIKVFGSFLISKTIISSFTDFLALTNTFSKNFNSLNRSLLALPIQKKDGGRSWSLSSPFCLHYIVFFTSVLLTAALRNLSNIKAKHSRKTPVRRDLMDSFQTLREHSRKTPVRRDLMDSFQTLREFSSFTD